MRTTFPAFRRKYPVFEGKDYSLLDAGLSEGWSLAPRSLPMLYAIGMVMNNCLKHGQQGNWHNYDRYMSEPDTRLVVLCGADDDMHVFLHANYIPAERNFRLTACVGKQNTAPEPRYHAQVYEFIRQQGWIFDEKCNYAAGNVQDPEIARAVETYHRTLPMVYTYRGIMDPIRMDVPREAAVADVRFHL